MKTRKRIPETVIVYAVPCLSITIIFVRNRKDIPERKRKRYRDRKIFANNNFPGICKIFLKKFSVIFWFAKIIMIFLRPSISDDKMSGPVNGNECYFWRTTGCVFENQCRYKHVRGHKGVDLPKVQAKYGKIPTNWKDSMILDSSIWCIPYLVVSSKFLCLLLPSWY